MKILVTPRSFGKTDPGLFNRLIEAGFEIVRNETGGILDEKKLIELITDCDGVILGVDPLNKNVLSHAKKLQVVSRYGVGLDNVDLEECEKRGIKVTRTLGAIENAVADYTFALILGVARRICLVDRNCRANDWAKITTLDVYGKTLGIIGLGAVGKCVARRAKGFEMAVIAHDINWDAAFAEEFGIVKKSLEEIFINADIISLHCSLNDETRHLVNTAKISLMKRSAILINTARGALIDDNSLLKALQENRIYGAGLDVFEKEPPAAPIWRQLENVILGSHGASSTKGAVERMGNIAIDNLLRSFNCKE